MISAEQYLEKSGWTYKESGVDHVAVEVCPYCSNSNFKFFMNTGEEKNGVWDCKVCGESGNLYRLVKDFGLMNDDKDMSVVTKSGPQPLPDFHGLHKQLMNNSKFEPVLDHLVHDRKLKLDTIAKFVIGAAELNGELWFVMPSFSSKGEGLFYKSRNLPGTTKKFSAPSGREAPLFNASDGLKHAVDSKELFIVEGEMDCISMVNQGYLNTVGVPGANVKKTEWITELRSLGIDTFYLIYDLDKTGQPAALTMAKKIGLDKVKSIVLPAKIGEEDVKDVTNFFCFGGTKEQLDALKKASKQFDIDGVYQMDAICDEINKAAESGTLKAEFDFPWEEWNTLIGGAERGDVIGIIAEGKVGKSTVALNLETYWASKGFNTNNLCLEMKPARVGRKIISHLEQAYDGPDRTEITPEIIAAAKAKMDSWDGKITLSYANKHDAKEVMELIRNTYRRYSSDVVVFDNLQMLGRSMEHSAQEMSRISKDFKALAMELNILLVLIIQPHRVGEGQMVGARNASGSAAIEKDVDIMIALNRKRTGTLKMIDIDSMEEEDTTFLPQMVITADLCRFGPGGRRVMYFDGGISTLRSLRPEDAQYKSSGIGLIKQEEPIEV